VLARSRRAARWLLPLAPAVFAAGCAGPGWNRDLAAVLGERGLDSGADFPGIRDLAHYGLELDWRRAGHAFGFESALTHSHERNEALAAGGSSRVDVVEASFGLRHSFLVAEGEGSGGGAWGGVVPYVGAGLTWTHTELRVASVALGSSDEEDWDAGIYAHVGAKWFVAERLFLGLDYRRFFEDFFDYGGFDLDSDVLSLRVGYRF
jgi:opacity protein-like surface antigen